MSSGYRRLAISIAVLATLLVVVPGTSPAGAAIEEVNFVGATSSTPEGSTPSIKVQLTYSGALAGDVTVNLAASATGADPAEAGDYSLTDSITFLATSAPPSGATMDVPLTFTGDAIFENSETLLLTITSATGAVVGVNDTHVAEIFNDDEEPTLRVFDSTADEDTGAMQFKVTRTGETELAATALATPTAATATAGSDFTATGHPISIPPGDASASDIFTVSLGNDNVFELTETFNVTLSALGAAATDGSDLDGVGTILDDEDPPTVSVNNVSVSEAAGTATFTLTRLGRTAVAAEVDITTSDGTATAGVDFAGQNTTLSIPASSTTTGSETLVVPIVDDDVDEPDETYLVTLSNPVAATVVTGSGTGTIIDNDVPGLDFDLGNGIIALEGGDPDTFDVTLTSEPIANVTLSAASTDGETAVTPSDLTFTPSNWDTPQSFTVMALEDGIDEDDPHNGVIRITTGSTDPGFASLPPSDLIATIGDADALLVQIDGPSVGIPGSPATFTATVNAGATGDITYEWTAFQGGEAVDNGDQSTFHFTPSAGGPYIVQVLVGDSEGQNPAEFIPFRALSDVSTSVFVDDILWLAEERITQGCNPPDNDQFCPRAVVTRGQMAAFLVRFLGLADDGGGNDFTDDNDSIFEDDIAKLAAAGITRGCNPPANTNYCPNSPV
ncbi:MAG: PKD domain-containing protein, partial [bacterium]|nr:PKD domain-containing protein [bacterium]